MGCGCSGKSQKVSKTTPAKPGEWMLVESNGNTTYYATQLAARAANAKTGGRGLVRRVK
jgi:hypothetical protein